MEDLIKQFEGKLSQNILEDFKKEANARKLGRKDAEKVLQYLADQ